MEQMEIIWLALMAVHRVYDAGVDDNLVCSRRSVCISDSVARIESGNPDWRFCSCICCTAVFHKTMGCEVSEYQNGQDEYGGPGWQISQSHCGYQ